MLRVLRVSASFSQLRQMSLSSAASAKKVPRIYTKTGDKGTSALFTGERRPKNDAVFEALGDTDELSSVIGFSREFVTIPEVDSQLETIQCILQDLQSVIATPETSARDSHKAKVKWNPDHLDQLEQWTDQMTQELPPLKNFILPSGGKAGSALHVARAVSRRAERRVVALIDGENVDLAVVQFLNRLSSYLFIVARFCAFKEGFEEKIYRRPK